MTKKGEMNASVHLGKISSIFTCFYINIQNAKTKDEKQKLLDESIETLRSFQKKLENCNAL